MSVGVVGAAVGNLGHQVLPVVPLVINAREYVLADKIINFLPAKCWLLLQDAVGQDA